MTPSQRIRLIAQRAKTRNGEHVHVTLMSGIFEEDVAAADVSAEVEFDVRHELSAVTSRAWRTHLPAR